MLPEHENLIYKHFPDLVKDCDLEKIMKSMSLEDTSVTKIMDNVKMERDRRHNNRCILFQFIKMGNPTTFHSFVSTLRRYKFEELANKLENKTTNGRSTTNTWCTRLPDPFPTETFIYASDETLKINVRHAMKFCDNGSLCYKTRSRNRGHVLIINNILFDHDRDTTRKGAEIDESNLKQLFEKFGMRVEVHRNLNHEEIQMVVETFAHKSYDIPPDMGVVIIMSHGLKFNNKTVVVGTDGRGVEEEWIATQFNNKSCPVFRKKPKILIFNYCRGSSVDNLSNHSTQTTECDSACVIDPKSTHEEYLRSFSDLLICHPSVEGYQAHRDTIRGCWYIELLCKVFMEEAHEMDIETMLKMVELGLERRVSEKMTTQTSTFLNTGFKTCYLNPGIYEEDGVMTAMKI